MRGPMVIAMLLISTLLQRSRVAGLIAYDCADQNINITTISLNDVTQCPDPKSAYASEKVSITVLQRSESIVQHVWTCLVEITRLITHCGMHSHSSIVAGGLLNYVHQIGAEECRLMHQYRTIKIHQQTIGGILMNGTTTASLTLYGSLDNTGSCRGISYQENGNTWNDVVVTATVKIQATDYYASVKLQENQVHLKGAVLCPYLKGYCFDSSLGESTWDYQTPLECEGQLNLLFDGLAERVTETGTNERFIVVNNGGKIFALMLVKKIYLCHMEVWQTEHPRLLVREGSNQQFLPFTVLLPQNTDLMSYVNSKFLYVEQAYKRDVQTLYIEAVHRRCLIQREILKNRLLLAPLVPHAVSQIIQEREGYIGRVLGEVLYIARCIPKNVQIRRTEKCYQELPVKVDNQSKFMTPTTRVLQNYGEEIECNTLTPPLYYIDGSWVGLVPHPMEKRTPKELEVSPEPVIAFQPIQPLGSKGLYTQDEIDKVQRLLTFGQERKVVENIIARRVAGMETGGQGFSTLGIFDPEEIKELAHSTVKQLWGWFSNVGIFMSGLIGFYFIYRVIKYILGVVINGFHLYRTVGGGIELLACVWNTLTLWVIHRHYMKNGQHESDRAANENAVPVVRERAEITVPITSGTNIYPQVPSDTSHWTDTKN